MVFKCQAGTISTLDKQILKLSLERLLVQLERKIIGSIYLLIEKKKISNIYDNIHPNTG